jgi:hypothetical protein
MTRTEELENTLRMLLAMCDRLRDEARHAPIVWDDRTTTIFYFMELARACLADKGIDNATEP